MKPEKIIIKNNNDNKLTGYLYKNKSKTVVIICHGLEINNGYPGIEDVFEWYHRMGASVFSFDFSGYGESEGEKGISLKQRDADIKAVLDYFSSQYEDIILYGVSFAGISVAIAAAKYRVITKLITVNGFFTFNPTKLSLTQIWLIISYILLHPSFTREIYYSFKKLKIEKIIIPTFVIYGENDTVVNPQQSKFFYSKLHTKKEIVAVPNGDHALMRKEDYKVTKAVPEWIRKQVIWK
jgi:pimeloyl-ACP methyl ester carboxylesterase